MIAAGSSASPDVEALHAWWPGSSPAIREFREQYAVCLTQPCNVLLVGEPGVGKGRAARLLHRLGPQGGHPYVTFDPRAALDRQIVLAGSGTLKIDGAALFDPAFRDALAGVMARRAASGAPIPRLVIVLAERSGAKAPLASGLLDERLGLRLLWMPPLLQRRDDLEMLCQHLLADLSSAPPVIMPDAMRWIGSRIWPGNVRQLRDCVQRAALLGAGRPIDGALVIEAGGPETSPLPLSEERRLFLGAAFAHHLDQFFASGVADVPDLHAQVIAAVERPLIERVLGVTEGNQLRAAAMLGLNRNTLRKRMQELRIEAPRRETRRRGGRR